MSEIEESQYKRLNPKSRVSMYIGKAIGLVIWAAIVVAAFTFFPQYLEDNNRFGFYAVLALSVIIVIYSLIEPIVYYARYRYVITDDCIDIRKGVIILRHIVVPIERVHQVEVVRGPINNIFGLADLHVTTAGGTAAIEYLDNDVADSIADDLKRIINTIVRDRNADA